MKSLMTFIDDIRRRRGGEGVDRDRAISTAQQSLAAEIEGKGPAHNVGYG
jgi:hypothetical protein